MIFLIRKSDTNIRKADILALPYYPYNWPGGHERIANWKPYFEKRGLCFDVYWASNDKELLKFHESKNPIKRYYFYFIVLFRRLRIISRVNNYNTIWIQRNFIPFYPFKDAFFEKLLSIIHPKVIMDYYDADYVSNYNLTINSVKNASKVTVSTSFLKNYYLSLNSNSYLLNMTIDYSNYTIKKNYVTNDKIKIGWMGSRGNMIYLKKIENELKFIEDIFPNVSFHFLCRDGLIMDLKRVKMYTWKDPGFNYSDWLTDLDIGIAPYFGDTDTLKAKSSMKSLEFMACGIPLITSEHGIFEGMIDKTHFILANNINDWKIQLKNIIPNNSLRKKIGLSGYNFFKNYHTYESNLDKLIKILIQ
ncbi:glycosyltransferase family 4 protein [Vicingus serpentipes]|uniref:Glycosyltransferase family 4 protein n=1 Tax=Vicingus serpentipes TaxID=1926625 RepID=A0A5C6RYY1_9FLAO|nr:glycosyltransferase [Vicingus serpentipes]TXB67267.1 glycosyltransferase family 4 protein [Vicingus serpentipes]